MLRHGEVMRLTMQILGVGDDTLEQQAVHVTLKQRMEEPDDVIVEEKEDNQEKADEDL